MDIANDCIPCTMESCRRLTESDRIDAARGEELLRRTAAYLENVDRRQTPPALAREMHRMFREILDDPDPYLDIKRRCNEQMLQRREELRRLAAEADDPFAVALRLAIAGNVIDFGAKHLMDPDATIRRVLEADLAIDDTEALRSDLAAAETVLYIGDNAGEIVLDGVFLETIAHPRLTFAVRGGPVLNDALVADAELVGIDRLARIVTTGDDAPGVIWRTSSLEFREIFKAVDVVVAKGQGNLEGLIDADRDIHFLLTTKCERIANHIGVGVKDFVAWKKSART